jgi:hypothetical protein
MEDVAGKIILYHNLFLGCLILSIVCLVISVILFFVLDISKVWGYLTGRKAKKQIQQMEESSAASGRLMTRRRSNMQNMAQGIQEEMGIRGVVTPGARKVDNVIQNAMQPPEDTNTGTDATSLLQQELPQKIPVESVPLQQEVAKQQTKEDKAAEVQTNGATGVLDVARAVIGAFAIEKEIVLIHAEEVI